MGKSNRAKLGFTFFGLAAGIVVTLTEPAQAFTSVCDLANTVVPVSDQIAPEAVTAYKLKLQDECELSEKYQQMMLKGQKYGVLLEEIAEYQALRYIRRSDYDVAKTRNTPVPLILQFLKSDINLPNAQKTTLLWNNYLEGIRQLPGERSRVAEGAKLSLADLRRIQLGFYTLTDETRKPGTGERSDFANDAKLGVFRPKSPNDRPWLRLEADKVASTQAVVDEINATFKAYGLLDAGLEGLYGDRFTTEILSVRPTEDGDTALYAGDSRANEQHLEALLLMIDEALDQARRGRHMVVNDRLVTPAELAFLAQQFFVDVHIFYEGNGRVSRFLQELILTLFWLPHGASGDLLSNDVTTPPAEYYQQGIAQTRRLLTSVDACFEKTYPEAAGRANAAKGEKSEGRKGDSKPKVIQPVRAAALNQSELDYGCRILRD